MQLPLSTLELLEQLKHARGWPSDYRLACEMRWKHASLYQYRRGLVVLSAEHGCSVADLLEIDRGYVLAILEAERARRRSRELARTWLEVASRLTTDEGLILSSHEMRALPSIERAVRDYRARHHALGSQQELF